MNVKSLFTQWLKLTAISLQKSLLVVQQRLHTAWQQQPAQQTMALLYLKSIWKGGKLNWKSQHEYVEQTYIWKVLNLLG